MSYKKSCAHVAIRVAVMSIVAALVFGCAGARKADGDSAEKMSAELSAEFGVMSGAAEKLIDTSETVTIGTHTWMKRNLNIETDNSWCYDDEPKNCERYGRLYTWDAAVSACSSLGGGWRLAREHEWAILFAMTQGANIGGRLLKAEDGWGYGNADYRGTDDFGFSALPGGARLTGTWTGTSNSGDIRLTGERFVHLDNRGYWWGIEEEDSEAIAFFISRHGNYVGGAPENKNNALSVRCVRDYDHRNPAELNAALASLRKSIQMFADDSSATPYGLAVVYYDRGNVYLNIGEPEKAIKDAERAIETDSGFFIAYNSRGLAYIDIGEYEKAIEDFDKALADENEICAYFYNRGLAYAYIGDDRKSAEDHAEAQRLSGECQSIETLAETLAESVEYYGSIIFHKPQNALAHYHRGVVYMMLSDYENAAADFKTALNLDPNHTRAKTRLEHLR